MSQDRSIELYEIKLAIGYLRRETALMDLKMVSHFLEAALEALEHDHGPVTKPDGYPSRMKTIPHNDG